jgi:hypothetical protein
MATDGSGRFRDCGCLLRRRGAPSPSSSRAKPEAQSRDPGLGGRRKAGWRRRGNGLSPSSRPTADAEAWIPDTSSCAALGRRSGVTKGWGTRLEGAASASFGIAAAPLHHWSAPFTVVIPGEAGAEAQTRDPGLGGRREAGWRRRGNGPSPSSRSTAVAEAWIPDTSSFASLGRRSGMTKRMGDVPGGCCVRLFRHCGSPASPLERSLHRRHPGRSRSGAEAQTRDPGLGGRRKAGWR